MLVYSLLSPRSIVLKLTEMQRLLVVVGGAALLCPAHCQDWSQVPRWADFGLYGRLGFRDLDYKLEFAMDQYQVISLEKCTGEGHGTTEDYFVNLTARMRELRPSSTNKILSYFATDGQGFQCYSALADLQARPELMLRDGNGCPVLHGNVRVPFYDFRQTEARRLWVEAALAPLVRAAGAGSGVFIDGTGWKTLTGCHHKTCGVDEQSCCEFTVEDEADYNSGLVTAVAELRAANKELSMENILIGNGLMNYDFNSGNGNPNYDQYVDSVDGFCMEHVMGFEISALENLLQLREMLVAQEKFLLIRSFPGPVGSPILNVGGLSTPQLPDHYHYTNPGHNLGMQAAMRDLFQFPLAVFLCGFAGPRVYYTYSVWWERTTDLYWILACRYDVRQSVPDREVAEDSQYPLDWTQYNDMNPGPPVGITCTGPM